MFQIQQTEVFAEWLINLRDARAKARILARLDSARLGNLGGAKSVGGGVSEMRIDVGAGYLLCLFHSTPANRHHLVNWRRQVKPDQGHCPRQADGAGN